MDEVIEAVTLLVEVLVNNFGVNGTVFIIIGIVAASFGWRYWRDKREDRYINRLLAEKDRTIQRLAEEERSWRKLYFKQNSNLSDEEIKSLVTQNDFPGPVEARKALEEEEESEPGS